MRLHRGVEDVERRRVRVLRGQLQPQIQAVMILGRGQREFNCLQHIARVELVLHLVTRNAPGRRAFENRAG